MKKFLVLGFSLMVAGIGCAQDVEHFEVGPYEVDYRGETDYNYRLKKGVDLYKYYNLEKDTVVQVKETATSPVQHAFQVGLSFRMPRYNINSSANVFGLSGQWKQRIASKVYFNGGLSVEATFYHHGTRWNDEKETVLEVGVPLSVEFGKIDKQRASIFGGIGVTPAFYGSTKEIEEVGGKSGFYVAPRVDFGGYIPAGNMLLRLGCFAQYNINCTNDDFGKDVFEERLGCFQLGVNIGLVL